MILLQYDYMNAALVAKCEDIVQRYRDGEFGSLTLPEDSAPSFAVDESENRLAFFTLPMSLNYRRGSDQLWAAARRTYDDSETRWLFDVEKVARASSEEIEKALGKYRLAMQPTRHTRNWLVIAQTVHSNWLSFEGLFGSSEADFLVLKRLIQVDYKRGFPYLSGPKLFNYWAFILGERCGIEFRNAEYVDIAVDTHIRKSSVRLGVVPEEGAASMAPGDISERWRIELRGSDLKPADLNVPLWSWSRAGFPEFPA